MKTCTKCGQTQENTEFYLTKAKRKDGSFREFRRSQCRACETKRKRKQEKRTKEERRDQDLKRKYGLTSELVETILATQGGCGICSTKKPGGRYATWNVDHCHKTGKVRGILCWNCNVGIGKLKDDTNLLRRAIRWLERSKPLEDFAK